jgi:CBS domain-containing protein
MVRPSDSTDLAVELMWRHEAQHLLAIDRSGLVGMVSADDLMASVGMLLRGERLSIGLAVSNEEVLIADIMDCGFASADPQERVIDAARRMLDENRTAAAVVDETQVLGVLTAEDLLGLLAGGCWVDRESPHHQAIAGYSSAISKTVRPEDSLAVACARLSGSRLHQLPVTDQGQLVGVLSDGDIRSAIESSDDQAWLSRRVESCMSAEVQTLRPGDTLACAAEVMRLENLTAVPITSRDGELLGVIGVADVLRALIGASPVHS